MSADENLKPEIGDSFDFIELIDRAKSGDVIATHDLAIAYEDNESIEQDLSKALFWHMRAADMGSIDSKYRIGRIFQFGLNGPVDLNEALKWYVRAIEGGHSHAKVNLALMYFNGEGVEQDYNKAGALFQEAAIDGSRDAQNNLGCMFYDGLGFEEDKVEAAKWLELAANQGCQKAQLTIGLMYRDGIGVDNNYELAFSRLNASAMQGDDWAQYHLGNMLISYEGIPVDQEQGYRWIKSSADQGNAAAIKELNFLDDLQTFDEEPFKEAPFTMSPTVELRYNGTRSILITVKKRDWSSSSEVILGGINCKKEELEIDTEKLTFSGIISHGFIEIQKSRAIHDKEFSDNALKHVPGDVVTIDWRVQKHHGQAFGGLLRLTYCILAVGHGYKYLGGFNDYYYGGDESTKNHVKAAKLALIEETVVDEAKKRYCRELIEADFNQQIPISELGLDGSSS
jgi:TPR repeat protein